MPEASLVITNSGIPDAIPEPGFIAFGELTLNWADSALYFKDISGTIQSISVRGITPIFLDERLPVNEDAFTVFAGGVANSDYYVVQKAAGTVPRIKIGIIASGTSYVSVTGTDITVGIRNTLTMNQIKALITGDADANELIYFYNAEGSTGVGVPSAFVILASATFEDADPISGDRSDILGQIAIVTHSTPITAQVPKSEWAVVSLRPTIWGPRTAGIIYNVTDTQWELLKKEGGVISTVVIPDQP